MISLGISWHQTKIHFPRASGGINISLGLDNLPAVGTRPLGLAHLVPKVLVAEGE